jgi:putative ABC transport system permease protein
VVGVVQNAKLQNLLAAPGNFFYVPQTQNYKSIHVLQLRTLVPPQSLIVPTESLVRQVDPNLPVYDVMTMERAVSGANGYFLFKVGAGLAASLGAISLLLAVVGVYGVVSYSASQRKHEIGIRMALGADRRQVLQMVLGEGAKMPLLGIAIGLVTAFGLTRLTATLLFGVGAHDPLTYAGVTALLAAVALAACYIPARRATKVDPMVALRYE